MAILTVLSIMLGCYLRHESAKLEGEWQSVDWNFAAPSFTLMLEDGVYRWRTQGAARPAIGRFRTRPLVNPAAIDLLTPSGECLPGIYQMRGSMLTIVHGQTKRPADFSPEFKNGEQPIVMTFYRVQRD
jgi:hypothetical protein